ncbi:MAG: FctA domain-containing protein [Clostridiaceae bacterium]
MFTFKRKIKRKRTILAALLLFSFIIGLAPSGLGKIYAEELNSPPIIETAAAIIESPVEPILPPEEIAPAPAEIVIEPVEEPVEIPPEVVPEELLPAEEIPVEVVPPVVEAAKAPDPIVEEPLAPVELPLQEKTVPETEVGLAAAPEIGILAVPTGGDYNLVWSAADPAPNKGPYDPTYNKLTPAQLAPVFGRADDPLANAVYGVPKDAVSSLEPADTMLGQIVPFELLVTVGGTGTDGIILVTPYWLTKTTSGQNFGFDPNYMVYAAFVDYGDDATVDPDGDATASVDSTTLANPGTSNEQIQGTLKISGLDAGDKIVVEIWVVLKSAFPPGNITGNVQTGLVSAQVFGGGTISAGNQTVPLSQVGSFDTVDTEVSIIKSDSPDPLFVDQNLTYLIRVQNNTAIAANGIVVSDTLDPFVAFVSATGGGVLSGAIGGYGGLVTWPAFNLSPNYSTDPNNPTVNSFKEFTLVVHVSPTAPTENFTGVLADTRAVASSVRLSPVDVTNIVRIASIVTDDTNLANNVYQVPTNILRRGAPTSIILNATKVLTGKDLTAGMFNFRVLEGTTEVATGTNDINGNIAFTAIPYTVAGNHTYTIVEVIGSLPGITYSTQSYTVTVSVIDNLLGSLVATPTYPTGGVVFNNSYTTGPTSLILSATKALTGRTLTAGMFSFELRQGATVLQTVTNAADGSITFAAIPYVMADRGQTFNYTIVEVVPVTPETGMNYDPMIISVSVLVTDNGDGTLTATPTYPMDITFNNSYTASGSIAFTAHKTLDGRTLVAGEFSFQLKLGESILQTKTNNLVGAVSFDPINYTVADIGQTYTYTITEVVPAIPEPGMFYDAMTLTVSVLITDAGNGVLTVTPTYPLDVIFNNTFKTGDLEVKKVDDALNPILNNEATFELRQGSTVIEKKTSLTTGIASFDDLSIGTYTLVETIAPTGFELNPTVYTVIVQLDESDEIEVIVKTGGVDGTVVSSDPLVVIDKKLGSIVIEKLDSVTDAPLAGAEFDLYHEVPEGTEGAIAFTMLDSTVIYGIKVNAASLVTGADGKTTVVGNLIQGNYFAVETKVPVGYKLLLEPVRFTLNYPNLTVTQTIKNVKAPELPQTGGVGTMVFSIAGIGLMIGAMLAYKKYNSNERIK